MQRAGWRNGFLTAICVGALGVGAAFAQDEGNDQFLPPTVQPQTTEEHAQGQQGYHRRAWDLTAGAGVEGYSGVLRNRLNVGPEWGATLAAQPLRYLGGEIAYSGATHEVSNSLLPGAGAAAGADFVRNGGSIAVSVNAPSPIVQPYVLGGVGFDHYDYRAPANNLFRSDTSGSVPLAAGVKGGTGKFVADARFTYDVLFSQNFARLGTNDNVGGAYSATLQVGGRF